MAQIDVLNKSEDTSPDKAKYQKTDLEEDGGISSHRDVDRYGYLSISPLTSFSTTQPIAFDCVLVSLKCDGKGEVTRKAQNMICRILT